MMFNIPQETYDHDERVVRGIEKDECSPLNVISDLIEDGSKVLDLGAGAGLLADILAFKDRKVNIDGIEKDEHASRNAEGKYRKFYCGDFTEYINEFSAEEYDYIVLADVLEHLVDPQLFWESIKGMMGAHTKLIISVPNVTFGSVPLSLLNGKFEYTDTGLIERTHLRFFTSDTLSRLFSMTRLFPEKIFYLHRNFLESEIKVKVSWVNVLPVLSLGRNKLASVYQFVYILRKNEVSLKEVHRGTAYHVNITLLLRYFLQGRIIEPLTRLFG